MKANNYTVTAGSALNAVVVASLLSGTALASENQTLWPAYQPAITAQHTLAAAPTLGTSASTSTEIVVDHGTAQLANMAKLAAKIVDQSRGVDAEIGAAVEENFFDWI
jgi:hypothetical protein